MIICISAIIFTKSMADGLDVGKLPGWHDDDLVQVWSSWQSSCDAFRKKGNNLWIQLCNKSSGIEENDRAGIRQFFQQNFRAYPVHNQDGSRDGTITGYYEPVLNGSLRANNIYQYPVYGKPDDASLLGLTRAEINSMQDRMEQEIILWTDNPYDLYFLHVQGSGRIKMDSGELKSLVYAGNNGHDYTSIGKVLINQGDMEKEKISMQTLKQWLIDHPARAKEVIEQNERFIFFKLTDTPEHESGPRGSLNVPLTPGRSIAIDPNQILQGSPLWIDTTLPSATDSTVLYQRLVFAQDTGAAIKGRVRADVFFGQGDNAEFLAGNMNQLGQLYLLVPIQD